MLGRKWRDFHDFYDFLFQDKHGRGCSRVDKV
jgi:hypothetical protein